jgi:hypothetical protein
MNWQRGLSEALLFLVASAVGIYGLGEGLNGFYGSGPAEPAWLAVTALALIVLAKQMARVQDHWPRRDGVADHHLVQDVPRPHRRGKWPTRIAREGSEGKP